MTAMDRQGAEAPAPGIGVLRLALLFGTAVIAFALILTPMLAQTGSARVALNPGDFDLITTGSIAPRTGPSQGVARAYTIRRSVLQDSPGALCIIQQSGEKTGDC